MIAIDPRNRRVYVVDVKYLIDEVEKAAKGIMERLERGMELMRRAYGDGYEYIKVAIVISKPNVPH